MRPVDPPSRRWLIAEEDGAASKPPTCLFTRRLGLRPNSTFKRAPHHAAACSVVCSTRRGMPKYAPHLPVFLFVPPAAARRSTHLTSQLPAGLRSARAPTSPYSSTAHCATWASITREKKLPTAQRPRTYTHPTSHAAHKADGAAACMPIIRPHRAGPCGLRRALPSCSPGE